MSDVDAQAWALRPPTAGSSDADWFAQRLTRARTLLPDAGFDTNIRLEFAETITTELVDVVGVADAVASDFYSGGVVELNVGDDVITPSQGRLQLTGSGSHVGGLSTEQWYTASLARFAAPLVEADIADTEADAIALWSADTDRVILGVLGNASGGSTTNFVGAVNSGASWATVIGPPLPTEQAFWHLWEIWFDGDALHFAIDGVEFDDTIDVASVPALSAKFGPIVGRSAVGDQATMQWDKACVIVASPAVGT